MPKPEKIAAVNKLKEIFSQSKIMVFVDFRGMSALKMSQLRAKLKDQQAELKVVKNDLAKIALENSGEREGLKLLTGPTAIIFSSKDELSPIKTLVEYKGELTLKGGLIDSRLIDVQQLLDLAKLPSKGMLLTQLLNGMKSPLSSFIFTLSSLIVRLISILKERERDLSGGGHGTS